MVLGETDSVIYSPTSARHSNTTVGGWSDHCPSGQHSEIGSMMVGGADMSEAFRMADWGLRGLLE